MIETEAKGAAQPAPPRLRLKKITVFSSLDRNPSIDRYAEELSSAFPPEVDVDRVWFGKSSGLRGRVWDKHFKYAMLARRRQGEANVIVSEGYSFLLFAVDPRRTLVVCHDVHPLLYPGRGGAWRLRYRLNLRIMARARAVVTVSENTRRDLLRNCPWFSPEQVVAIHSGLGSYWKPFGSTAELTAFRKGYGLENKRVVLHVGNDNWYKNFGSLLRAVAKLSAPDLLLVKVGEIGAANRRLADELRLDASMLQIPYAATRDLVFFYNLAEMLVFPSLSEGFGWPPLEAMACGCPVIASRGGSLPEVLDDSYLPVEATDVDGLAAAISRLLNDPALRASLVASGLRHAAQFQWTRTAQRMLEILGPA